MTFGEKIKEVRTRQGLSQLQLGEKMNITQQAVAKYERLIEQPKLATVRKLAEALEVTISELVIDWSLFSVEEYSADLERLDKQETKLLTNYRQLNEAGQNEAQRQMEVLTKVPDFQK